jgi:hypothetical protein
VNTLVRLVSTIWRHSSSVYSCGARRPADVHAGVGDQDVDAAQLFDCLGHHTLYCGDVGHVRDDTNRLGA